MNSLMNGCDFRMMDSDAPPRFPASGKSLPTLWQRCGGKWSLIREDVLVSLQARGPQGLETVGLGNLLGVHQREEQPASNPKALAC